MTEDGQLDLFVWASNRPTAKVIHAVHRWAHRDRECLWQALLTPHPQLDAEIVDIAARRAAG
ncbi:hypothetical protein E2F50_00060 [Rhizobium deserti]|uniref:Uncharacterized protein n=1 Tax=Rhizobium deserti TaxID=2547961 RepID=A0A4R5ULL3_9HYPH|nr:hypothetical protein [Rhizobium deserti]TDK38594.1 hypothetical protein E2F50_00060 [Rhizobium deserti]